MKTIRPFFIVIYLIAIAACSKPINDMSDISKSESFEVTAENAVITKNGFDAKGKFYWSSGDRIGVTTTQIPEQFSALSINSGAGTGHAKFTGSVYGEIKGYAVYPYSDNHSMNGTILSYDLPAMYSYETVDKDFFSPTKGNGNSFNAPMWSEIQPAGMIMKHLGGVFCIKFHELPVGQGLRMILSAEEKLNGTFDADLNQQTPILSTSATATETEKQTVIEFSNSTAATSGVFYVPVATGQYTKMRIKIKDGNNELVNTPLGNQNIQRCNLRIIELKNGEINIEDPNQIVEIPDEVFRAYILKNFDTDKDGKLTRGEAAGIQRIDIDQNVTSITGIEWMSNLKILNIDSSADLHIDFTKFPKLESLGVAFGTQHIDISGHKNIKSIIINSGYIKTLKANNCPELKAIGSFVNTIESVDFRDCPKMESLSVLDAPNLSNLDYNLCPELTSFQICGTMDKYSPINTLYLQFFPKLKQLGIPGTSFENLWIWLVGRPEACKNIEYLNICYTNITRAGLEELPNLKHLICGNSKINDLDKLHKCPLLEELDCSYTQTNTLDLTQNKALTSLNCSGNNLPTLDISQNTLLNNIHIKMSDQLQTVYVWEGFDLNNFGENCISKDPNTKFVVKVN